MRLRDQIGAVVAVLAAGAVVGCGGDPKPMEFGKAAATLQPCGQGLHAEKTPAGERWKGAVEQVAIRCGHDDISHVLVATYPTDADARRGLDEAPRRIEQLCQVDRYLALSLVTANYLMDRVQSIAEEEAVQRRLDERFCDRAGGVQIVRTGSRERAARRAAAQPKVAFVGRPQVVFRAAGSDRSPALYTVLLRAKDPLPRSADNHRLGRVTLNGQAADSLAVAGTVDGDRTCFAAQFVPVDESVAASPPLFPRDPGATVVVRYELKGRPVARAFGLNVAEERAGALDLAPQLRQLGCVPLSAVASKS